MLKIAAFLPELWTRTRDFSAVLSGYSLARGSKSHATRRPSGDGFPHGASASSAGSGRPGRIMFSSASKHRRPDRIRVNGGDVVEQRDGIRRRPVVRRIETGQELLILAPSDRGRRCCAQFPISRSRQASQRGAGYLPVRPRAGLPLLEKRLPFFAFRPRLVRRDCAARLAAWCSPRLTAVHCSWRYGGDLLGQAAGGFLGRDGGRVHVELADGFAVVAHEEDAAMREVVVFSGERELLRAVSCSEHDFLLSGLRFQRERRCIVPCAGLRGSGAVGRRVEVAAVRDDERRILS